MRRTTTTRRALTVAASVLGMAALLTAQAAGAQDGSRARAAALEASRVAAEAGRLDAEARRLTAGLAGLRGSVHAARAGSLAAEVRLAGLRGLGQGVRGRAAGAPEPWLQEDPADSLYRAARAALNDRQWERAATLFGQIRERHPRSGYAPDSYYFQALALSRAGGSSRNQRALALLEEQGRLHPAATSRSDADQLAVRVRAALAQTGDARAAVAVEASARQACDGADQELRATALSALLNMDAERARPILMEVLRSRDECSAELRERAVFLVAQKLDDEAVDILLDLAHRNPDPDGDVREQAVFWLSNVKTPEAVAALESILRESRDPDVQESAVFALSRQGSPRAVQVLRSYAERADAPLEVREQAIFWLGRNAEAGGGRYLRELYPSLRDPDLKEAVIFGVAQSGGEDDRAWLLERARDAGESMDVRKNALFWAGRAGSGLPVEELRGLYASFPDAEMKEQVIFVLSREGSSEAVDALMEIARSERDPELRENAVFWLGRSDDPRVAEFLLGLIRGGGR